jgi:LmbE family N-acetylglucosaminyl deacetylase
MKILVIAPHPDDETLGCGGTLIRHKAEGDEIHWIVVTVAHDAQWDSECIKQKAQEVSNVAEGYGMASIEKLDFPTARLDQIPMTQMIDSLRQRIESIRPDIVYLVHDGDVHTDHHIVFTATLSVLKTFYMKKWGVRRVLSYEVLSSTEAAPPQSFRVFVPNVYVDVTSFIDRKLELMSMYKTEVQQDPYPRGSSAIRALARYRGASIGVDYAEAFMLIREVI